MKDYKKALLIGSLVLLCLITVACEDHPFFTNSTTKEKKDNNSPESLNNRQSQREVDEETEPSALQVPAYTHVERPEHFYIQIEPNLLEPVSLNKAFETFQSLEKATKKEVKKELSELGFPDKQKLDNPGAQLNENELSLVYYALTKVKNNQYQNWFNVEESEGFLFGGLYEYTHGAVQVDYVTDPETKEAIFEHYIKVDDPSRSQSPSFFINYLVRDGRVYQIYDPATNSAGNLFPFPFGIAPTRMILPYDVKVGNTWEQEVKVNEETYKMVSEITGKPKDEIHVTSFINGIEGYPDNRYKEEYVLKKGMGIPYEYRSNLTDNMGTDFEFKFVKEQPVQIQ
ncbi:hypothetical protein [Salinibacillus kushneri]|uniref:hypothetical protein n=1 Tax=Salinibacillus kushneri TaxID=237682 RepID=UPI0015A59A53|nr:hypothetical protein [Salinibacillus kushneri]